MLLFFVYYKKYLKTFTAAIPTPKHSTRLSLLYARTTTIADDIYSAAPPLKIFGIIIEIIIAIGMPERAALKRGVMLNLLAMKIPEALVIYVATHMPNIVKKLVAVIRHPPSYSPGYAACKYVPFSIYNFICYYRNDNSS